MTARRDDGFPSAKSFNDAPSAKLELATEPRRFSKQ